MILIKDNYTIEVYFIWVPPLEARCKPYKLCIATQYHRRNMVPEPLHKDREMDEIQTD